MPYLLDRKEALQLDDVVIILNVRERRVRSLVVRTDNSLYRTLTRVRTLQQRGTITRKQGQLKGATWRTPQ